MMRWGQTNKADPIGCLLADRHYSRRTVGGAQFLPPGRTIALVTTCGRAVWASLEQRYVRHRWAPCWGNPIFRNEGAGLSSELIREALAATRAVWGLPPPPWGMVTFVDASKVRRKRDPGRCYLRAGFERVGMTEGGHGRAPLVVLSCPPERWPDPVPASVELGGQLALALRVHPCPHSPPAHPTRSKDDPHAINFSSQ